MFPALWVLNAGPCGKGIFFIFSVCTSPMCPSQTQLAELCFSSARSWQHKTRAVQAWKGLAFPSFHFLLSEWMNMVKWLFPVVTYYAQLCHLCELLFFSPRKADTAWSCFLLVYLGFFLCFFLPHHNVVWLTGTRLPFKSLQFPKLHIPSAQDNIHVCYDRYIWAGKYFGIIL